MPTKSHGPLQLLHFIASLMLLCGSLPMDGSLFDHLLALTTLEKYGVTVLIVIIVDDLDFYIRQLIDFVRKRLDSDQ